MGNQIVSSIVAGTFSRSVALGAILLAGCVAMADTVTGAAGPEKPRAEEIARGLWAEAPDFTVLSAEDRAWIEQACPRGIGPASWKRCAERSLEALKAGMPNLAGFSAEDRAWIEQACPRGIGPASWKRCAERSLEALKAGMPNLAGFSAEDRAWIEQACPRGIGPASWKRCAERNREALKATTGSRTPTESTRYATKADLQSTKGTGVGAARAQPVPATGKEEVTIAETTPTTARSAAAVSEQVPKLPKDPAPHLPKPADNERWLCTSAIFGAGPEREPSIVLTRETPRNQPEGRGKVAVAGVVHEAVFRVQGVSRRWDWSTYDDAIVIGPDGSAAYYNFRGLGLFETKAKPSELLTCVQG